MTLLISTFAAIGSTLLWYILPKRREYRLGLLALIYWGAALMWLVDAVAEYIEVGAEYFTPSLAQMLNDAYLGLSAVALGLLIWLIVLLIKDPKGVVKATFLRKE